MQRPASAPLDLLDPELDLRRALLVVGQSEHDRRLGAGAAGLSASELEQATAARRVHARMRGSCRCKGISWLDTRR
jgi:hypothetical protein